MKLGVIGCGNMGSALAKGILSERILPFNNIYVSDKDAQKTRELSRKFGIRITTSDEIAKKCDLIIIAVKPQDSQSLLMSLAGELDTSKHIISIMAGVTIARIESLIKKKIAITRAMPNMAALAGKSITCFCHSKAVKNRTLAEKIFLSVGEAIEIQEKHMDAITAITGSGPAYFFYLAECLRNAAVKLGIRKETATKLAVGTIVGSGALLDNLKLNPETLRERITSKKGTTEAALRVLKAKNLKKIIEQAARNAAKRSKELSR